MWNPIETPATPQKIFSWEGKLYLVSHSWMYRKTEDGWTQYLQAPSQEGYGVFFVAAKSWYTISCNRLFRAFPKIATIWTAVPDGKFCEQTIGATSKDTLWLLNSERGLCHYDPMQGWRYFNLELPEEFPIAIAPASHNTTYLAYKTLILEAGSSIEDASLGIAKPFKVGNILTTGDKTYISTEKGISCKESDLPWKRILETWGAQNLATPTEGQILVSAPQQNKPPHLWNGEDWSLCGKEPFVFDNCTLIEKQLFAISNSNLYICESFSSAYPPEPTTASYLRFPGVISSGKILTRNSLLFCSDRQTYLCDTAGRIEQSYQCNAIVKDVAVSRELETIVITSHQEIVSFDFNLNRKWIRQGDFDGCLCDITGDKIAFYHNSILEILDLDGNIQSSYTITEGGVSDLAISSDEVYLGICRLGVPKRHCYIKTYLLKPQSDPIPLWELWNTDSSESEKDSYIHRIEKLSDGNLLVAASTTSPESRLFAGVVKFDAYNTPSTNSDYAYYAVVSSTTGQVISGQASICRTDTMQPAPNQIGAIASNNEGIYIGFKSYFAIDNRDNTKFLDRKPDPMYKGEPTILKISRDMHQRLFWIAIPGNFVTGEVVDLDTLEEMVLATINPQSDRTLLHVATDAHQKAPVYSDSPYFVLW